MKKWIITFHTGQKESCVRKERAEELWRKALQLAVDATDELSRSQALPRKVSVVEQTNGVTSNIQTISFEGYLFCNVLEQIERSGFDKAKTSAVDIARGLELSLHQSDRNDDSDLIADLANLLEDRIVFPSNTDETEEE